MGDIRRQFRLDLFLRRRGSLCLRQGRRLAQVRLRPDLRLIVFLFKPVIIDLLLLRRQRRILLLQLQRLDHVFSAVEPEHQVIAGGKSLLHTLRLYLKPGELIRPFLIVLLIQILLQDVNLLIQRSTPAAIDLILQDILVVVMRGSLDILRIILDCLVKLPQLDAALHQPVQNRPAHRAAPVRAQKKHLAVLITLQCLIDLTDHDQCLHISDPLPVDGVGNPRRPFIVLVSDQTVDLLILGVFLLLTVLESNSPSFQVWMENRISTGRISSLPATISKIRMQVENGL